MILPALELRRFLFCQFRYTEFGGSTTGKVNREGCFFLQYQYQTWVWGWAWCGRNGSGSTAISDLNSSIRQPWYFHLFLLFSKGGFLVRSGRCSTCPGSPPPFFCFRVAPFLLSYRMAGWWLDEWIGGWTDFISRNGLD